MIKVNSRDLIIQEALV